MTTNGTSEDLWATSLATLQPKSTLQSLRSRLSRSAQYNDTLADLFERRAALEQEYVEKLSKLGRKVESGGAAGGGAGLSGGEGKTWDLALRELNETCAAHASFASTLSSEIAPSIREMHASLPLWKRVEIQDGNVDRVLKAHEGARGRVDKAQKKGGPKLAAAQSELANLSSDLEIQTPALYGEYQKLEVARLERLKEAMIKWCTLKSDLGRGIMEGSEKGMNSLLGWEIERDVADVPKKMGASGGVAPASGMTMTPNSRRQTMSSDFAAAPPSSYSPSPARNGDSGSINNLPQHTSLTSTLKSKFGRKNSTMGGHGPGFLSNRARSNSSATNRSGRQQSGAQNGAGTFETLADPGADFATVRRPSDYGRTSLADGPVAGGASSNLVDSEGFSVPPANRDKAPWEAAPGTPTPGGVPRNLMDDDNDESDSLSALPSAAPSGNTVSGRYNLAMANQPIQENEAERQAALAKVQSTLLAAPPSAGPERKVDRRSTLRARRDVRNTTFQAVPDDVPLAQALKMRGFNIDSTAPGGAESPTSGMVDSPTSGVFGAPMQPQFTGASASAGNPFAANMARQTSVASGTSSNPFDGKPLPTSGSGLRASITETINVLSKGGAIQRAMVTGEITLTLRDLESMSGVSGPIHIRLDQFEQLEKVAPNPKYLAQVPERPGEYFLNSEILAQVTAAAGHQPTLFKYQLHVGQGREELFAPIVVNPQWKAAPGETRLLLTYQVGRSSRFVSQASLDAQAATFSDLSVVAGLAGPNVSNVQAKPADGVWSPDTRRMTWKVGDLPLSTEGPSKIIARFLTEGEETGRPEGVQVHFKAEGALTSGLGISVVGSAEGTGVESDVRFEEVRKSIVSGKYIVEV